MADYASQNSARSSRSGDPSLELSQSSAIGDFRSSKRAEDERNVACEICGCKWRKWNIGKCCKRSLEWGEEFVKKISGTMICLSSAVSLVFGVCICIFGYELIYGRYRGALEPKSVEGAEQTGYGIYGDPEIYHKL